MIEKSSFGYKYVFWREKRKYFQGEKRYKDKRVTSMGNTAEACAQILNYKCREAGLGLPNPAAGFQAPTTSNLNTATQFKNIRWNPKKKWFHGQKIYKGKRISVREKTAEKCAQLLNFKCREAGIELPNPMAGCQSPCAKRRVSRKKMKVRGIGLKGRKKVKKQNLKNAQIKEISWGKIAKLQQVRELFMDEDSDSDLLSDCLASIFV